MKKILILLSVLLLCSLHSKSIGIADPSPQVDFTANTFTICAGQSVSFTDLSTNNPDAWSWLFPGGTPSSSRQQNPTVVYNTPGVYSVSLRATNAFGENSLTKTNFIKVFANPNPAFTSSGSQCLTGNSFNFTYTGGDFGTHAWNFSFGTPSSSTATNPSGITFSIAGNNSVNHVITSSDGCSASALSSVTVFSSPTGLSVSTTPSNCASATGSFTITGTTGGTPSYSFAVNGGLFTPNTVYSNKAPGTYTVVVKDANSCTFSRTVTVGSTGGPTGMSTTMTQSTCGNSNGIITVNSVTGGVSPYTYARDGGPFGSNTQFLSVSPGLHTVTVKDNNGCTFIKNVSVTNTQPTSIVITTTPSACSGATGSATLGAVTGGRAPYTYKVDAGLFTFGTTYPNLAAGTHTLVVNDATGCSLTTTFTITNTPGPTMFSVSTSASKCSPSTGTLSVGNISGGTGPYTNSIDGGATFTSAFGHIGLAAGTYTVVVKDANGCTKSTTATVTQTPPPTALDITTSASACSGSTGSITLGTVTGGTGPFNYSLDGNTFTSAQSYTGLAPGNYTVTVKDANGCTFAATATVPLASSPTAIAITTGASACVSSTGSIAIGTVTGGTSPFTFSLDGSAFTSTVNYSGLAVGTHTITVKDANGCTFSTSVTISSTTPTDVVLTVSPTACSGNTGSMVIGATTGGLAPLVYSLNGGAFTSTTNYTGLAAGTYTVTVKDFNNCVFTKTVTLTTTAPTAVALTITNSPCGVNGGAISVGTVTGGVSPVTFSLNGSAFTSTTSYTGLAAGTYTVVAKDANACTLTQTVTVNSTAGPTDVDVTNTGSTCSSNNGTISIGTVTGGTAPFTFAIDNGTFTTATNFTNLAGGSHTVKVKDAGGCIFAEVTSLSNSPGPSDFSISSTNATCGNANGTLTAGTLTGGTSPFTFSLNGSAFTSATSYTGLAAGSYTLTAKDANGCTITQSRQITNVQAVSQLVFQVQGAGCISSADGSVIINGATGTQPPFTYSFNGSSFASTAIYAGLTAGTYSLAVKDANGCTLDTTATVTAVAPGPTSLTFTTVSPACGASDGSVTISNVIGGTAPFLFALQLNGSLTPFSSTTVYSGLQASSYMFTVKDANGCKDPTGVLLQSINGPSSFIINSTNGTCNLPNASVSITNVVGGIAPYEFSANGSPFSSSSTIAGLPTLTSFQVIVKDANNCTFFKSTGIPNTGNTPPTPTISQSGFLLTSSASNGNQWFLDGVAISGETGQTHFATQNGSYTVVVTSGGCSSASSSAVVITNAGGRIDMSGSSSSDDATVSNSGVKGNDQTIQNEKHMEFEEVALNVFPNPNDGNFTISFQTASKTNCRLEVINSMGQVVFKEELAAFAGSYSKQLQVAEFGKGFYMVVMTGSKGRVMKKVITY
jgi:large repetitive protein